MTSGNLMEFSSDFTRFWLDENNIFNSHCLKDIITLEIAKDNVDTTKIMLGNQRVPRLIHMQHVKMITKDARIHFASKEATKNCPAVAMYSGPQKLDQKKVMSSFFLI